MKKDIVSVVVVLYKRGTEDSETLQSLLNLTGDFVEEVEIILWDNGPLPLSSAELSAFEGNFVLPVIYVHTPENISLATIYNRAIERCSSNSGIVLFDQDTHFTKDYFQLGLKALRENPTINLFLPVVKINNQIVSPGDFYLVKGKYWKNVQMGKVAARNKVAIASGMLIRIDFLKATKIRFNEALKLYNIDTDFVIRYGHTNEFFFVFNCELVHRISMFENEPVERVLFRFKDHRKSLWILSLDRSWLHQIVCLFYIMYLSVKFGLRYNNCRFLFR